MAGPEPDARRPSRTACGPTRAARPAPPNALYGTWAFPAGPLHAPDRTGPSSTGTPTRRRPTTTSGRLRGLDHPDQDRLRTPAARCRCPSNFPIAPLGRASAARGDRRPALASATPGPATPPRLRGVVVVAGGACILLFAVPGAVAARRAAGPDPQRGRVRRGQRPARPRPRPDLPRLAGHQLLLRRHGRAGGHGRPSSSTWPTTSTGSSASASRSWSAPSSGSFVDFIIRWRFFNAPRADRHGGHHRPGPALRRHPAARARLAERPLHRRRRHHAAQRAPRPDLPGALQRQRPADRHRRARSCWSRWAGSCCAPTPASPCARWRTTPTGPACSASRCAGCRRWSG